MKDMKKTTLLIMAAGLGSRYGGNKQVDGIGPHGEILMQYSIYDAILAGFDKLVFGGFALLENAYYLVINYETFSIVSALVRGFGTGLMHGMCTLFVGFGISFIRKRRKLFAVGTFALLTTAITYHSIFNMLVQSTHPTFGALLPLVTYLPFLIWRHFKNKDKGKSVT